MAKGFLAWTCLAALLGQLPADVVPMNRLAFKIPFTIAKSEQSRIRRMVLYVSTDRGRSWQQEATVPPDAGGFVFRAPRDGEYWFIAAAILQNGRQEPENIYRSPVDQKVLIDTVKPVVSIVDARRDGDDVVVAWKVSDKNPDPKSVRLSYRAGPETSGWKDVRIPDRLQGEIRFRISEPGVVTVRVEARDVAGNRAYAMANVGGSVSVAIADPSPPASTIPLRNGDGEDPPPPPPNISQPSTPPPPPPPTRITTGYSPAPTGTTEKGSTQNTGKVSWESKPGQPAPAPAPANRRRRPISGSGNTPKPEVQPPQVPNRSLPPIRYVNTTEVIVAYQLANIQPGRVGAVELWLTRDNGETWQDWMDDPAAKRYMKQGPHKRTLQLPGEGLYGLRLVVKNLAGKGRIPKKGDAPEMRIEVDLTPPVAVLYEPEPSKDRKSLIIYWDARDRNLAENPISLDWSEHKDGPWREIATSIANTGQFAWQPDPTIPPHVYLRLRVRDKAGNEAVVISNERQLVDLSEPQGRLIGILPAPQSAEPSR